MKFFANPSLAMMLLMAVACSAPQISPTRYDETEVNLRKDIIVKYFEYHNARNPTQLGELLDNKFLAIRVQDGNPVRSSWGKNLELLSITDDKDNPRRGEMIFSRNDITYIPNKDIYETYYVAHYFEPNHRDEKYKMEFKFSNDKIIQTVLFN